LLVSQIGAQPLFDETVDRVPTDEEAIERGLDAMERELGVRAPALLPELQSRRPAIRRARPDDTSWRANLDELNNLADQAIGLSFSALCAGNEPAPYKADCPFNGMKSFDYARRNFFKARERLTDELTTRLRAEQLVAVVGPSGSGKSSVVFAGMIPALGLTEGQFAKLAPGPDPLSALKTALSAAPSAALLVVDQFEELFTHQIAAAIRKEFLAALQKQKAQRKVVITLRSEFREQLRDTWLWPYVEDVTKDVHPMDIQDLRRAMEEQAAEVGLRFEAGLVPLILDGLEDEPGRMPLLQHTLLELWNRRRGIWLSAEEYRKLGGVHEAIARSADAFMDRFINENDRRRLTDIFLRLVSVVEESQSANETRRRVRIEDLVPAGQPEQPTKDLLKQLTDAYLVVTDGPNAELAHDALIVHWKTLQSWVKTHRGALIDRQELSAAAQYWSDRGRKQFEIAHRGRRLRDLAKLRTNGTLALNQREVDYLSRGEARVRLEVLFRNSLIIGTGLLIGILIWFRVQGLRVTIESEQRKLRIAALAEDRRHLAYSRMLDRASESWQRSPSLGLDYLEDPTKCPLDLRDFAWGHLHRLCDRKVREFLNHPGEVKAINLSPSGDRLVTLGSDFQLTIWDVATGEGRVLDKDGRDKRSYLCAAFSPDGKLIAGGTGEREVIVLDAASGDVRSIWARHQGEILRVAFAPDNMTIALWQDNDRADTKPAEEQVVLKLGVLEANGHISTVFEPKGPAREVAFSPDSRRLAWESGGLVKVQDWKVEKEPHPYKVEPIQVAEQDRFGEMELRAITFDEKGDLLAIVGNDLKDWLIDVIRKEERDVFNHVDAVVRFSPNGKRLVFPRWSKTELVDTKSPDQPVTLVLRPSPDRSATGPVVQLG
jgi:hypothetical protein